MHTHVMAHHQGYQHQAADDRHGNQRLEQRVGDELDKDDLPVCGSHKRATFEGELQQSDILQ